MPANDLDFGSAAAVQKYAARIFEETERYNIPTIHSAMPSLIVNVPITESEGSTLRNSRVDDGPNRKKAHVGPKFDDTPNDRRPSSPRKNGSGQSSRKRGKKKREEFEKTQRDRIREREERLLQELIDEGLPFWKAGELIHRPCLAVPHLDPASDCSMRSLSEEYVPETETAGPDLPNGEAERLGKIEESRRKMAELEADKPLWEEAAKAREAREKAEAACWRERREARRQHEESGAAKEGIPAESKADKAPRRGPQNEQKAQSRAEAIRREADRRSSRAQWTTGRWSDARAVERYTKMCSIFDSTRYSEDYPLSAADVPWPTLKRPDTFLLSKDLDWPSVEAFFRAAQNQMPRDEFASMIETSQRRFHTDRWRSRNLFSFTVDLEERQAMEIGKLILHSLSLPPVIESRSRCSHDNHCSSLDTHPAEDQRVSPPDILTFQV